MARKRREHLIIAGQPNHLITRGNNRRRIFSYPRDRIWFLRLLGEALRRTGCVLHALCLMTNHIHLLLTPPTVEAASRCMQRVLQRYAQTRNRQREASGKLYEQRFFSEPILDARQLALTHMYIEANPIRAGITTDALSFPWSTYGIHVGKSEAARTPSDLVTPNSWYLGLGSDAAERAASYRRAFAHYLNEDVEPEHADRAAAYERASEPYLRRLRRPDGSSAAEAPADFVISREKRRDFNDVEG